MKKVFLVLIINCLYFINAQTFQEIFPKTDEISWGKTYSAEEIQKIANKNGKMKLPSDASKEIYPFLKITEGKNLTLLYIQQEFNGDVFYVHAYSVKAKSFEPTAMPNSFYLMAHGDFLTYKIKGKLETTSDKKLNFIENKNGVVETHTFELTKYGL